MNDVNEILEKLKIEENIWIIYLIIIGFSFYSNSVERKYYLYNDLESKNKYRKINIMIFSIAVVVYCYFFKDSYDGVKSLKSWDDKSKIFFNKASLTASTLILVAGAILLYIAIFDVNLDTELAFN